MQAVVPRISVAPAVGSVVQRVAHIAVPVLAAGAGAAIVFHQRSSVSPSSVTLPRQGPRGRMQKLTIVNVEPKGPIEPRWHLKSKQGVQISPLSAASTSLLSGELDGLSHTMPILPKRRRSLSSPRASKDVPYYRYPAMTKKPKWWWRTLACFPYLVVLYSAMVSYPLHPFVVAFEFPTYWLLSRWAPIAYVFAANFGVALRKEWPHFLRFHVIIGFHLEIVAKAIHYVMAFAVYRCEVNMHFWTAIAFAFLFIVLESMRCALAGMYPPNIPYSSGKASRVLDSCE